jgi:hypothetical protein
VYFEETMLTVWKVLSSPADEPVFVKPEVIGVDDDVQNVNIL